MMGLSPGYQQLHLKSTTHDGLQTSQICFGASEVLNKFLSYCSTTSKYLAFIMHTKPNGMEDFSAEFGQQHAS